MYEIIMSEAYIVLPGTYTLPPLGLVLQQASLISPLQLQAALKDQERYPNLKIGNILALRSFIKQETADFFVEQWVNLLKDKPDKPIGYYLKQAAILEEEQIEMILVEQKRTGLLFGTTAVMQGNLNQRTVDFFLTHLFSNLPNRLSLMESQSEKIGFFSHTFVP